MFQTLSELDLTSAHKQKNNLTYLPWANAWTAVKTKFPDATYSVVKNSDGWLYHTDGRTCWVETSVTINGETQHETLAVMNYKNQAIPLTDVTSTDVGKSIKRCLVKNLALFGLDLNLWVGEEVSEAAKRKKSAEEEAAAKAAEEIANLQNKIIERAKALIAGGISNSKVYELIESVGGKRNPKLIKDVELCEKVLAALNDVTVEE